MWRVITVISNGYGVTYKVKRVDGKEVWAIITLGSDEAVLAVGDVLDEEFKDISKEYDMNLDITGYNISKVLNENK